MKIHFENVTESLSVPTFHIAYRELGDKHKLWGRDLDELAAFFGGLFSKSRRKVLIAFGMRVILTDEDKAEFYAGGFPGLLLLDIPIPPEAFRVPKGSPVYTCPHCNRAVDASWLDSAGVSLLATLYTANMPERIKKSVVEFCMVQSLEVCFPYSEKGRWHEADIFRIIVENVVAEKLGLPPVAPPVLSKQAAERFTKQVGFDIERWAETRARNIRQGIEPEPKFFAYKKVDEENES